MLHQPENLWSSMDERKPTVDLWRDFVEPPDEFRPVPLLTFTGSLKREDVFRAVDRLYEQEIRAFFIFPIYGMEVEYLSDEWFALVRDTVEYCRKKGMSIWIYDDYNWPNGNCGGKLIVDHPEYNIQRLLCETSRLVAPGDTVSVNFAGRLLRSSYLVENTAPGLADVEIEKSEGESLAVWTNTSTAEARLLCVSVSPLGKPKGPNWVANKGCIWQKENHLTTEYIDLLNPEAVECFISMTYERYFSELREYWGKTVKGFMTDEPSLQGVHHSERLYRSFENRYGYRIEDKFEHLFVPCNDESRQVRADYWRLAGELLSESWGRIHAWCVAHGVDLTGHFLGEESPGAEVLHQATSWAMRKNMTIPGMDVLFDTNYEPTPARKFISLKHNYHGLALTGKLASAAARYTGSSRAFAEAYGGFPHWGTPTDLTAQTHWTTAQGINFINDNTLACSWKGFRKRVQWGKHFTMPWWDCYGDFVTFAGRCCLMTAAGRIPANIALLYPVVTAQSLSYSRWREIPSRDLDLLHQSNYVCQQSAEVLTRLHRDWEVLWEDLVGDADIRDGRLCVKDTCFSVIVTPAAHCLEEAVLAKLEAFAQVGGAVVFVGALPSIPLDDINIDTRVKDLLRQDTAHFVGMSEGDDWGVIAKAVESVLNLYDNPALVIRGTEQEHILTAHRRTEGGDIFHLVNMSGRGTEVLVQLQATGPLNAWHPDDGSRYRLETVSEEAGCRVRLRFAPWEGYFIVSGLQGDDTGGSFPPRNVIQPQGMFHTKHIRSKMDTPEFLSLGDGWGISLESPNMIALDSRVMAADKAESGNTLSMAWDSDNRWIDADDDKLPFNLDPSQFDYYWHQAVSHVDRLPETLSVVVDSDSYVEGYANGQQLPPPKPHALWDPANMGFDLGGRTIPGVNVLVFKVRTDMHYHPDVVLASFGPDRVEPIVLSGSFGTRVQHAGPVRLVAQPNTLLTGDWRLQGLYGYSGGVVYRQHVDVQEKGGAIWLDLGDVAVFAEVTVNGRIAGRRGWPPYSFRIDQQLQRGRNLLDIRVKNTFGNLFRTAPSVYGDKLGMAPSGILGPCRLWRTAGKKK